MLILKLDFGAISRHFKTSVEPRGHDHSESNSHANDFNKMAHLLHLQFDTESCQQARQLDVLKMASQVVHPCVSVHENFHVQRDPI